jgi:hypothetical protein
MFAYVDMNPTILRSRQRRHLFVKDIDITLKQYAQITPYYWLSCYEAYYRN